jgi:hypothetical protein
LVLAARLPHGDLVLLERVVQSLLTTSLLPVGAGVEMLLALQTFAEAAVAVRADI